MQNRGDCLGTCRLADEIATPLETLVDLTSLTFANAERPDKVRLYMRMAKEQLSSLRGIAAGKINRGDRIEQTFRD